MIAYSLQAGDPRQEPMKVSVVIPTYNRCPILSRSVAAYFQQSVPPAEILVVDDGSSDATPDVAARLAAPASPAPPGAVPVRYFRQPNRGPGAARNTGIREAAGELILFTDDDIVPAADLVARHVAWHLAHPEPHAALCGRVTWSPEVRVTPFMQWYGERALVDTRGLKAGTALDLHHFWSGHLSFKTG